MENLEKREMPKNNMALAIVATVIGLCPTLCCINGILGGIAIYFATQVKKKYDDDDFEGAEAAAKNAKLLAYISLGLFVLGIIYSIVTYDAAEQEEMREKIMEMLEQYQ
jgi:xanthine/uracil/vitamin C permease (AzgA family)